VIWLDLRFDGPFPPLVRRLGAVLRFADAYTGQPVRVPLVVTIPALGWTALRIERDATYRFSTSNQPPPPAAPYSVTVEAPGGEYTALEPVAVTLPRPPVAHPPPVRFNDYLVQPDPKLWPTRAARAAPGETVIIGRLVNNASGAAMAAHKVVLFQGAVAPAEPYARTDSNGDFIYRLPGLKTQTALVNLNVEVRNPANSVVPVVSPAGPLQVRAGTVVPDLVLRI